jgi:hypothetical protein
MTPNESEAAAAVIAILVVLYGFMFLLLIAMYIVQAIAMSRLFRKTGVEPILAWVPIYGYWKWLELGGFNGALALLFLVPFANYVSLIFLYVGMYRMGFAFRKDSSWVLLGIFLPFVWCFLLARDTETYEPALQTAMGTPPLTGLGVGAPPRDPMAPPAPYTAAPSV